MNNRNRLFWICTVFVLLLFLCSCTSVEYSDTSDSEWSEPTWMPQPQSADELRDVFSQIDRLKDKTYYYDFANLYEGEEFSCFFLPGGACYTVNYKIPNEAFQYPGFEAITQSADITWDFYSEDPEKDFRDEVQKNLAKPIEYEGNTYYYYPHTIYGKNVRYEYLYCYDGEFFRGGLPALGMPEEMLPYILVEKVYFEE